MGLQRQIERLEIALAFGDGAVVAFEAVFAHELVDDTTVGFLRHGRIKDEGKGSQE